MEKKAGVSLALVKAQLKQFGDTSFMPVPRGLLETVKAAQYAQNTTRCDVDSRRMCLFVFRNNQRVTTEGAETGNEGLRSFWASLSLDVAIERARETQSRQR